MLDFSLLQPEEAEELDEALYQLYRNGQVRVLHYREPFFLIEAGPSLGKGYRTWRRSLDEGIERNKKRLNQVKEYVTKSVCRSQVLLRHLGEGFHPEGGCGCDVCTRDKGPWEGIEDFTQQELERVYRPLEVLLAFFQYAERYSSGYGSLGKDSTIKALRGEAGSPERRLGRKYMENRFFGHLSFISEGELERTFEEALKEGFLQVKGGLPGKAPLRPHGKGQGLP